MTNEIITQHTAMVTIKSVTYEVVKVYTANNAVDDGYINVAQMLADANTQQVFVRRPRGRRHFQVHQNLTTGSFSTPKPMFI